MIKTTEFHFKVNIRGFNKKWWWICM